MDLYPAIDLRAGRCVRLVEGDFAQETVYGDDPVAVALAAVREGKPFLGICVGMQMMYEGSEESPRVPGLGLIVGCFRLLPEGVKRPQMQWNVLQPTGAGCPLLDGLGPEPWVYFVHSYAAPEGPDVVATCEYGGPVVAAVGRDRMWATQFHPEKSGAAGLRLLANFAATCG